ncbi:hypothetical protein L2728_01970 [Shewanella chilikensis]|uniref:hypothetical protein n=1 Tax=Shewanella chilikensis TaxID=558541 RepID=UPI0020107607|nr:hypothetical protein [Shewanella chilikensis]MCL1160660.1 hypothetical protein [Shewanella chilikensis]
MKNIITKVNLFWLIQSLPLIKRFFYWNDALYLFFSALSPALSLNVRLRLIPLLLFLGVVVLCVLNGVDSKFFFYYFLGFVPFIFVTQSSLKFEDFIRKSLFIFFVFLLYGIYQKIFGYSWFEIQWILSDKGEVGALGFGLGEVVRPFSVFAGIPDFTLLIAIFTFYFFKKNIFIAFLLFCLMLVVGSRGVIVGFLISLFVVEFFNNKSRLFKFGAVVGFSFGVYALLIFLATYLWEIQTSGFRLLNYGTFNARFELVLSFFDEMDLSIIYSGLGYGNQVFDNAYLSLLNDFGIVGVVFFILFLFSIAKTNIGQFTVYLMIVYAFFADVHFSFFLMSILSYMTSLTNSVQPRIQNYIN